GRCSTRCRRPRRWSCCSTRWGRPGATRTSCPRCRKWVNDGDDDSCAEERTLPRRRRRREGGGLGREGIPVRTDAYCVVPMRRLHEQAVLRRHALEDRFPGCRGRDRARRGRQACNVIQKAKFKMQTVSAYATTG